MSSYYFLGSHTNTNDISKGLHQKHIITTILISWQSIYGPREKWTRGGFNMGVSPISIPSPNFDLDILWGISASMRNF